MLKPWLWLHRHWCGLVVLDKGTLISTYRCPRRHKYMVNEPFDHAKSKTTTT